VYFGLLSLIASRWNYIASLKFFDQRDRPAFLGYACVLKLFLKKNWVLPRKLNAVSSVLTLATFLH
jgi:hypothetical protein